MRQVRVLLIGAGGYGGNYVNLLANKVIDADYKWVGVVDPYAAKSEAYSLIVREGIPVFDTPEAFFAVHEADLTVIATPIPLHAQQSICAMEHGSDVLLEKPIAGTSAIASEIIAARDRTGRKLFLGYQWCYDDAMLRFKTAADRGDFGRPLRMRSLVIWHRYFAYYNRNNWAGKSYVNGNPVFDSVSSNATAHYLFNMLWLGGNSFSGSAPIRAEVITARANDIETFDTAIMRFELESGVEILHVTSHAASREHEQQPMFIYEFENAIVRFGDFGHDSGHITALMKDGTLIDFGNSVLQNNQKLEKVINACGPDHAEIVCPAEAALQHARAIEMARAAMPEAVALENVVRETDCVWVEGLAEKLIDSFNNFKVPASL